MGKDRLGFKSKYTNCKWSKGKIRLSCTSEIEDPLTPQYKKHYKMWSSHVVWIGGIGENVFMPAELRETCFHHIFNLAVKDEARMWVFSFSLFRFHISYVEPDPKKSTQTHFHSRIGLHFIHLHTYSITPSLLAKRMNAARWKVHYIHTCVNVYVSVTEWLRWVQQAVAENTVKACWQQQDISTKTAEDNHVEDRWSGWS